MKLQHCERFNLPKTWNKDWFHLVNIQIGGDKKIQFGYIWATDNWVEVHCFKNVKIEGVFKFTDDHADRIGTVNIGGDTFVPSSVECSVFEKTLGFVFTKHVCSFIMPRHNVRFSTDLKDRTFYKKRKSIIKPRGFVDTVYCSPCPDDFNRWQAWHPDDQRYTVFPGGTLMGYYLGETHGDYTIMYKIEGENAFEELGGDDLNITTV